MRRKEINERSPVRVLESSIRGGLGPGNIGVVIARHGVGKTAFLVGVALDDLMRGRQVLHVSLEHDSAKIRAYYEEIFGDLAHERGLEDVWKVRAELERSRRIHCFLGSSFSTTKLRDVLESLRRDSDFKPVAVMLDGFPFDTASSKDLATLRELVKSFECELWMSAVTHRDAEKNERGIPEPVAHHDRDIDVILRLAHDMKAVHVSLLKDYDNPNVPDLKLALDPTTMLLEKE